MQNNLKNLWQVMLNKISVLQWSLLFIAIILIAIGVILENPLDIYRKAIFICMECIGIG